MQSISEPLDKWHIVLYMLELLLDVLFLPMVTILLFSCLSQKTLPANLRSTLFTVAIGKLICALQRLILIPTRLCCVALKNTPFTSSLLGLQSIGIYLSMFAWIFLVAERSVASLRSGEDSTPPKGCCVPPVLSGLSLLLCAVFSYVTNEELISDIGYVFILLQILFAIFSFLALLVIMQFNISVYRRRHVFRMRLNCRYHVDENIRVSKYLIPVAINDLFVKVRSITAVAISIFTCGAAWLALFSLPFVVTCRPGILTLPIGKWLVYCKILFILLTSYSIFFTSIPLGRDTSHLSHAYDLLHAYSRVFFALWLTTQNGKFVHSRKRNRRIARVIQSQIAATPTYFTTLRNMWY